MNNLQKYISTEVGEMPVDWKRMCLEDISEFITKGATPTTYGFKWEESGIPFLRSECVSQNGFIENGISFISEEANNAMNRSKVQSDDILISITGNVGRVAIYPKKYESGNINQHIARVRIIKDDIVDRLFIYFQVNQPNYRNYYNGIVTGAAYPQLSLKQIRETPVFVPPLETQKRIASILSSYDDLIENNLKRIKLLEETAQNIYKEWFVNFRFPNYEHTEFDSESGLPIGWEMKNLGDIIEFKVDNRGRNPSYYSENGIPVIDNFLLKDCVTVDLSFCKRYIDEPIFESFIRNKLEPNDVLITLVGNGVGSISIAPQMKSVIIQNTIGLRCNYLCTQYFLYYFLFNNKGNIQNMNRGAAQPSVKVGDLFNLQITLPKINIINDFSSIIEPVFSMFNTLTLQNQNLKEARDILLPRLMNRTIEV